MENKEITENNTGMTGALNPFNLKKVPHSDINHLNINDKDLQILDPFSGSVTNQREFGTASIMAKALRNSLSSRMIEICESYVSGRLTAQFRNLATKESGKNGMRPLYPSKYGHLLAGFEFNTTAPYDEIFGARYFVKCGSGRGQVILHFPSFIPIKTFKKPSVATNFKINARLVAISDYHYDCDHKKYIPLDKKNHGKYGFYDSGMLPLLKIPIEPMTTRISIEGAPHITKNVGLFLVMAISFFEYRDHRFIHLPKESAMQIKRVY